jgi:hypothetical protein
VSPPRVIALVAAFNEEDVIGQAVGDLIAQGVQVYFIDHASTDGTMAEVARFAGRGLVGSERFEGDRYQWEALLRRKEELQRELDADWFLHTDADELRESPWEDRDLTKAIETVDRHGYNAIDFQVFNFRPTRDGFKKGEDLRAFFQYWEPGDEFDRVQIKCWKKHHALDLTSSGGHDARFPGRRVFPVRFILRHYPVRSQEHGERKVFRERKPRFVEAERARRWHIQYDAIVDGHRFVRDAKELERFDLEAARLRVWLEHRGVDELQARGREQEAALEDRERQLGDARRALEAERAEAARLAGELERDRAHVETFKHAAEQAEADRARQVAAAGAELDVRTRERDQARQALAAQDAALNAEIEAQRRLGDEARARVDEQRHATDEARARLDDQRVLAEELRLHLAAREAELEHARAEYEAVRARERDELERARAALADADQERAGARRQLDADAAALAAAARDLEERGRALADADRQLVRAREVLADAEIWRAEMNAARDARDRARAELDEARAHLLAAEARLDEFYGSRTWRWSSPARLAWRLIGRE